MHYPHKFWRNPRTVALSYRGQGGRVLQACQIEQKHHTRAFWKWPKVEKRDAVTLHIHSPSALGWEASVVRMMVDMSKATSPEDVAGHWSRSHESGGLMFRDPSKHGIAIQWPDNPDEWIELPPQGRSIQDAIKDTIWSDPKMKDTVEFSVHLLPANVPGPQQAKHTIQQNVEARTQVGSGFYSFRNRNRSAPYSGASGSRGEDGHWQRIAAIMEQMHEQTPAWQRD